MKIKNATMYVDYTDGYYWKIYADYLDEGKIKEATILVEAACYDGIVKDFDGSKDDESLLSQFGVYLAGLAFWEGASNFDDKVLTQELIETALNEAKEIVQ